jgi:hypothetical protein
LIKPNDWSNCFVLNFPEEAESFVAKYEGGERRLDVVEFITVARAIGADPVVLLRALRKIAPDSAKCVALPVRGFRWKRSAATGLRCRALDVPCLKFTQAFGRTAYGGTS